MNTCIVIPFYNHAGAIAHVVEALKPLGLPCRIVDDGSDAQAQQVLAQHRDARELGDGSAPAAKTAAKARPSWPAAMPRSPTGFTHALQIDADGQHDVADAARLLEEARRNPAAMVSGEAVYDSSVPRSRRYGRYLTHVWVWINTLSFEIRDSMCGLRVYPLAATCAIWRGTASAGAWISTPRSWCASAGAACGSSRFPTHVTYPRDGVSHFRMLKDNVHISWMHTRLFFGMLRRLPSLLARRVAHRGPRAAA